MQFGVLGPLLIREANGPVTLTSAKQRALLAILLLETPHNLVPASRLVDELWGENPPATAGKALQVHVSQLRRTLGPEQPIVTRPNGYALHIDPQALDLHRFDALLAQARGQRTKGDLDGALRSLQEALGLWRGPALADVTLLGPSAGEADRLEGLCAVAHEERMELELARGGGAALVPELAALIASDPYREHMHGLLMLALYRAGRRPRDRARARARPAPGGNPRTGSIAGGRGARPRPGRPPNAFRRERPTDPACGQLDSRTRAGTARCA
jgi:DNA-binding SARP family transcriptional activator